MEMKCKLLNLVIDNKIEGVISPQVLSETKRIMINKFGESSDDTSKYLEKLLSIMQLMGDYKLNVNIKHETDKTIIGSAAISKSEFLISGDDELQNLKEFEGMKIINASKFLKEYLSEK